MVNLAVTCPEKCVNKPVPVDGFSPCCHPFDGTPAMIDSQNGPLKMLFLDCLIK
jgi:hypothetical protein